MKRKNLIMSLAVVATMGMVLTGCGNKPEKVAVEVQETEEVQETQDDTVEEPTQEEEATEPTEEVEATTEDTDTVDLEIKEGDETVVDEQVEVGDYLSEHGITITPYDSVTSMLVADSDTVDTTHERNVTITVETVPSDEEGYSDTIFKAVWDRSDYGAFSSGYQAYDRYTGISLTPADGDAAFGDDGGTVTNTVVVEYNSNQYDCTETFDWDTSAGTTCVCTYTVHHPSDYDGVVFQMGKQTATMIAVEDTVDKSVVRKIADYPELMEDQLYFTASNK